LGINLAIDEASIDINNSIDVMFRENTRRSAGSLIK
jgi:hypothetical protein